MFNQFKNRHNDYKRKYRSIFVKLFIIMVLMVIVMHYFVVTLFGILFQETGSTLPFAKYGRHYAHLISHEIGSPPDWNKAKEIAEKYDIKIRYENGETVLSTANDMRSVREEQEDRIRFGLDPEKDLLRRAIVHNPDGSAFLFRWDFSRLHSPDALHRHVIFYVSIATFAFLAAFLFILYVLAPIKHLRKGVTRISEGDLDVNVRVKRNDELGHLADALNIMAQRIREMIRSRDQLLVDVSHELRSPITRIKLAMEFLPQHKKKYSIRDDLNEMETMITEILGSEQIKNGRGNFDFEECDLIDVINETLYNFEGRPPGIELNPNPGSLVMNLDRKHLKIVLQNVLQNALKYSREDSQPVKIVVVEKEDAVVVSITDDGIGVPEEDIPHLFEPFYRVDRSRSKKTGGYGLGLSLSQRIMEAHKGTIHAENNENRGVTFTLLFPK